MPDFWMQASSPTSTGLKDPGADDLFGAVQMVFPMDTEDAILYWNQIPIELGYKYDFSQFIEDLIELLEHLIANERGAWTTHFFSSSFDCTWKCNWHDGKVTIQSEWEIVKGDDSLLEENDIIEVEVPSFLSEWKKPLEIIRKAVVASGYLTSEIRDLEALERVLVGIG